VIFEKYEILKAAKEYYTVTNFHHKDKKKPNISEKKYNENKN
jgi:hypothetical protein